MNFNRSINVGNIVISESSPVFIIAEAGVNHNGDINIAKQLIDVAASAGANAVKFQSFKTESLILENVRQADYQIKNLGTESSQFLMLKNLEMTCHDMLTLKQYCEKKKIMFLTTPFDEDSLEELDNLSLDAYKVSSTDTTNIPFLRRIAQKNKPIILSTGMSYYDEVKIALAEIYKFNKNVILLQCTSNYPLQTNEVNLAVLDEYKECFDTIIGFSDHTEGIGASPFAVARGAKVIEKHFTLNKEDKGPDHKASLSPAELNEFILNIRNVESMIGSRTKAPTSSELNTRNLLQKCLVAKTSIKKGEILSLSNLVAKRTGGVGISPIHFNKIENLPSDKDYLKDEPISYELYSP